jgi:hypothetical protein
MSQTRLQSGQTVVHQPNIVREMSSDVMKSGFAFDARSCDPRNNT